MLIKASKTHNKKEREKQIAEGSKAIIEALTNEERTPHYKKLDVKVALENVSSAFMRQSIFETGVRRDAEEKRISARSPLNRAYSPDPIDRLFHTRRDTIHCHLRPRRRTDGPAI